MTKKDREEHFSEKEALVFHAQGKPGKIEIKATKPLETQRDLSLAYSPGVAAPVNASLMIQVQFMTTQVKET